MSLASVVNCKKKKNHAIENKQISRKNNNTIGDAFDAQLISSVSPRLAALPYSLQYTLNALKIKETYVKGEKKDLNTPVRTYINKREYNGSTDK